MYKSTSSASVYSARILLALNGLIWLLLAVLTLLRRDGAPPGLVIIAVLMVANAGAMLLAAWFVTRGRIFYFLTLALLLVNVLLTFTDQFGLLDLLTLLVDLFLLTILLLRWHHFLP
jgi:hypothetical protein